MLRRNDPGEDYAMARPGQEISNPRTGQTMVFRETASSTNGSLLRIESTHPPTHRPEPEHIHLTVKEPGKNEYYLDDYLFEDDPILTDQKRKLLSNRGGSGIGNPKMENGPVLPIRL